jgi:hypothetical protein
LRAASSGSAALIGQSSFLKESPLTTLSSNTTNTTPTVLFQIWVAARDIDQAAERQQAIQERVNRFPMTYVGSGFGRFFYKLWCERTGADPLALQGDCIADTAYHLATQDVSPTDLAALTRDIAGDLENALSVPVAGQAEAIPAVEEVGAQSSSPDSESDAGAIMAEVSTEREHATILAALRYVARCGGFGNTMEADIAANSGAWDAMSPDEIDELGNRSTWAPIPCPTFASN